MKKKMIIFLNIILIISTSIFTCYKYKDVAINSSRTKGKFKNLINTYKSDNKKILDNLNDVLEEQKIIEEAYKIDLPGVVKETGKVNIYLFWGNGCPHCQKEKEFLDSITDEYGNYFNLYTYEVWYNNENKSNMNIFASLNNETVTGVPYTIIGNYSFKGFGEATKEKIKNAILEEKDKGYDIYIDKIKGINNNE